MPANEEQLFVISNRGQGNLQPTAGFGRPLTQAEFVAHLAKEDFVEPEGLDVVLHYQNTFFDYEKNYLGRYDADGKVFHEHAIMAKADEIGQLIAWLEEMYQELVKRFLSPFQANPKQCEIVEEIFAQRKPRQLVFIPKIGGGGLATALKSLSGKALVVGSHGEGDAAAVIEEEKLSESSSSVGSVDSGGSRSGDLGSSAGMLSLLETAGVEIANIVPPTKKTIWVSWVGFTGLGPDYPALYWSGDIQIGSAREAASQAMSACGIAAEPVFLTSELHDAHYAKGSNGLLWPINHAVVPSGATAEEVRAGYELMCQASSGGELDIEEQFRLTPVRS